MFSSLVCSRDHSSLDICIFAFNQHVDSHYSNWYLNSVIKTKLINTLYIYLHEFAPFFAVAFSLEKKKGFI